MRADEIQKILDAYDIGEEIQWRDLRGNQWCAFTNSHRFNFNKNRYRVKPSNGQVETTNSCWINAYQDGSFSLHRTKEGADNTEILMALLTQRVARIRVNYRHGQFDECGL